VDAGVVGPRSYEFAAGFATWYLRREEAATPMLLEASEGTVARQGNGQTKYDGAVQPGAVGMEVERPTDGAVEASRGAVGATTAGSTDTAAAGDGMDVTTTGRTGGKKKKKRKHANRKQGGSTRAGPNERRRRPWLMEQCDGELRESP